MSDNHVLDPIKLDERRSPDSRLIRVEQSNSNFSDREILSTESRRLLEAFPRPSVGPDPLKEVLTLLETRSFAGDSMVAAPIIYCLPEYRESTAYFLHLSDKDMTATIESDYDRRSHALSCYVMGDFAEGVRP